MHTRGVQAHDCTTYANAHTAHPTEHLSSCALAPRASAARFPSLSMHMSTALLRPSSLSVRCVFFRSRNPAPAYPLAPRQVAGRVQTAWSTAATSRDREAASALPLHGGILLPAVVWPGSHLAATHRNLIVFPAAVVGLRSSFLYFDDTIQTRMETEKAGSFICRHGHGGPSLTAPAHALTRTLRTSQ